MSDEDFKAQLATLNEELATLHAQARALEEIIAGNVAELLEVCWWIACSTTPPRGVSLS